MPRIEAPTLAEHHAQRRAAIVAAAVDLLGREGIGAVTPAAVASGSGLARSSLYQYFPSTAALVAAAVEESFTRTRILIERGQSRAATPAERVLAWVDSALTAAVEGHDPTRMHSAAELPEECRAAVAALHLELTTPLVGALDELGNASPEAVAELVGGAVAAAAGQVARGASVRTVRHRVRTFVLNAVT
jgi:AcrR family transcriptional regulator